MSGMTSHGHTAGRRSLAAIHPRELRFAERLCAHVESDQRSARTLGNLELGHLQRMEVEVVVMRLARRRAGSTVADAAIVASALHRTGRQEGLLRISGSGR